MINLVTSCSWDSVEFFIFSKNVFDPLIYYSHLGPLLASLVLFVFIFLANRQEFLNKLLLILIALFCTWSFLDLVLWADDKPQHIMFVWSTLIIFETAIYGVAFYFVYYFIHNKDLSLIYKMPILLLYLPVLFFLGTHYNLEYFDFTNCEREAAEGKLWVYEYVVEIIFVILILSQLALS